MSIETSEIIDRKHIYKLSISYCGADFHGWQSQPSGMGIQDHVEKALSIITRESLRLTSSSRTDSGVHAEHQVVTFRSKQILDEARLIRGLNAILPNSVRIMNVGTADDNFHPIFSSTGKIYRYRIWRVQGEHVQMMPYVWKNLDQLDISLMRQAGKLFEGDHDFTSFCAIDSSAKSKVRRIFEIRVEERGPILDLWFHGEGFLKQMVRNLVGCMVACGGGKLATTEIEGILMSKDRRCAPPTAPAKGLSLVRVCYDENTTLESLLEASTRGYNLPLDMISM